MSRCLGIDTSNYTTSVAVTENGSILSDFRTVLDVKEGERGLRQSDAVFAHTVNLPKLFSRLGKTDACAVGVSYAPRDSEGSYMPCFLAGISAATAIASIGGVPLYKFSHQAGHIAAALYSSGNEKLIKDEFIAFHVSGGTTEIVHVNNLKITPIGGTKDISAGKAIDRAGVMLGLKFPCGKALEALAGDSIASVKSGKISVDGLYCNLSGLENKVIDLVNSGAEPSYIAAFTLSFVSAVMTRLTENVRGFYPNLPIIYSGGVMSNKHISTKLSKDFGGSFAKPELSCDNAVGISFLTELKYNGVI